MPIRLRCSILPTAMLCLLLVLILVITLSPRNPRTEDVRLATMRLGTSWYVFGATLYKLIHDEMPAGTRLEIVAKGGGIANPILVNSGEMDVALANRASAIWAVNGHPLVYEGRRHPHLRALVGGLNAVWVSAMVRERYVRDTGHESLETILLGDDPVRLVMKPPGSSVPVVVDMILAALGTDREKLEAKGGRVIQADSNQIPDIFRNGQADLYIETTPLGHPTVTEVSLTVSMRFLDLPPQVREALEKDGLAKAEVPKFFNGQSKPLAAVDLGTVIIANEHLSEATAYLITRTICENKSALSKAHKAWSDFEPEKAGTLEKTGIELHPGARRYYEERGWLPLGDQP